MAKVIFITGIDTHIGKSVATGFYAKCLMQQGYRVITQKMIQTGCKGISEDIIVHRKIQGIELTKEDQAGQTCAYLFDYPCSPHLAAQLQKQEIDAEKIHQMTLKLAEYYDVVLLEGAGGLAVPYNQHDTILDYIVKHHYPIVLVTSGKLGSINHTLLSLKVCKMHNIVVESVIYNLYPTIDEMISQDTQQYLQQYLAREFPNTQFVVMNQQKF